MRDRDAESAPCAILLAALRRALSSAWQAAFPGVGVRGRRRPLSARRPLAWRFVLPAAAAGLIAGEVAAESGEPSAACAVAAIALAAPAAVRVHRALGSGAVIASVAALAGLALGTAFFARRAAELAEPPLAAPVEVEAVVESVRARPGFAGRTIASVDALLEAVAGGDGRARAGERVRLSIWDVRAAWQPGDRVRVVLALRRPRGFCNGGGDRWAEGLWRSGVRWVARLADDRAVERLAPASGPASAIARARRRTAAAIDASVPAADAAVLRAIVVGDPAGLPDDLRNAYARTGTTHVLSVSGLHIAIVAGSAHRLTRAALVRIPWLALRIAPARAAALVALVPATAYALFAGAAVATVRSLLMAGIYFVGLAAVRSPDLIVAIAAAALAICALDPAAPFDVSFQLSFGAVIAIVAGVRALERTRLGGWLRPPPGSGRVARARGVVLAAVAVAVAASVGTAPLTAAHFGTVPLVGVLANLVVVPLVGWGALLAGLLGTALLALGDAAARLAFALAGRAIALAGAIANAMAELPGAAIALPAPGAGEAACWIVGLAGLVVPRARGLWLTVLGCGAAVALAIAAHAARAGDRLRVSFLDVGQGDAAIVELPGARALVVDGGGIPGGLDPGAAVVLPALRMRRIASVDAILLSHPQLDHYGGLAAVARALPVRAFGSTGATSEGRSFGALEEELTRAGIARARLRAPPPAAGDDDPVGPVRPWMEVVHPPEPAPRLSPNDASLVVGIRHGAVRVLFAGDAEARAERMIISSARDLGATALKAPHHGSRTSSSPAFVAAVRPGLVVAGVGERNRFGLPAPEIPARWQRAGALWRDTARDGEVVIESDGQLATVATCRVRAEDAAR